MGAIGLEEEGYCLRILDWSVATGVEYINFVAES